MGSGRLIGTLLDCLTHRVYILQDISMPLDLAVQASNLFDKAHPDWISDNILRVSDTNWQNL